MICRWQCLFLYTKSSTSTHSQKFIHYLGIFIFLLLFVCLFIFFFISTWIFKSIHFFAWNGHYDKCYLLIEINDFYILFWMGESQYGDCLTKFICFIKEIYLDLCLRLSRRVWVQNICNLHDPMDFLHSFL